jgi:hypothetical protein
VPNKKFKLDGLLRGSPAAAGSGQSVQTTEFPLGFEHSYPREDSDSVSINSSDISPYVLPQSVVPSARLIALRVISSATVKVKITTVAGTDQAFNVSGPEGLFILTANTVGDEVTAIKLVGVADIEYLIAGDTVAGVPPPPTAATPGIAYNDNDLFETTTTSEDPTGIQFAAPFSMIPGSFLNVEYRLALIGRVTGGTGTVRVRRGGTIDVADGTQELSGAVTETSYALKEFTATVAKPSGTQLVKVTMEHPTSGQTFRAKSIAVIINGV